MMNLRRLIREFVELEIWNISEGTLNIPKDQLAKNEALLSYIKDNLQELVKQVYHESEIRTKTNPYMPASLENFFQVERSGITIPVDVGFYGHDSSGARLNPYAGTKENPRANFIINMDNFWSKDLQSDYVVQKELEELRRTINHELVHARDPFPMHPSFEKYEKKHYSDVSKDEGPVNLASGLTSAREKYFKSQPEYAAYASTFVEDLKGIVGEDKQKISAALKIIAQVSALPLEQREKHHFPANRAIFNSYKGIIGANEYIKLLAIVNKPEIKAWVTRPTLFKKFLKDMATSLTRE